MDPFAVTPYRRDPFEDVPGGVPRDPFEAQPGGGQRRIFSGGTFADILDVMAAPGYATMGAIHEFARPVGRALGEGRGAAGLAEGLQNIPGGAGRGIMRRASFGDILAETVPEWQEKHPLVALGATLAADVATYPAGPVVELTRGVAGGAARGLRSAPVRRAGANVLARLPGPVREAAAQIPRGVGAIERVAARYRTAPALETQIVGERIAAQPGKVGFVQRRIDRTFDEVLGEAERGMPQAVDEISRRARVVAKDLAKARANATRLEGEAARAVEVAGQGEQRGVIRARQRFVDARRAEARATARYAEVGRDYVRAQREHMELTFKHLTPEEHNVRVDALLKRYVDAEEELDMLAGAAQGAAEGEMAAQYARMAAQEELPPLIEALSRRLAGEGQGTAYALVRNAEGRWVRSKRIRPQKYYSGDLFDEIAAAQTGRGGGDMMLTAEAAGEETASLLDRIGEYLRRGHRAKTERWEIEAGGSNFFKDTGEVRIGLTETELRAAIRGMKAEAAPGLPRGMGKAAAAREGAQIRGAEATVEELNNRIGILLSEAEKGAALGRRVLPPRFRVKGQERALPAAARLDEASRALDRAGRDLQSATRGARTAETRWGEVTGSRAPLVPERVARTQEKLITREVAGPDVGGPRALPPAPARETPWQRAGLGPEAEAVTAVPPTTAPRVSRGEALRAKAMESREGVTTLEAEHARLIRAAQELGATEKMVRAGLSPRDVTALRDTAHQRTVAAAQKAAQETMDLNLRRLAKVSGQQVADEVGQTLREIQLRAMRRTVQALRTGALTPEQVATYGKFHVWRGYEAYTHPEHYLDYLKSLGPEGKGVAELLRTVKENVARSGLVRPVAFGKKRIRGVLPKALGEERLALDQEVKRILGELPIGERFAIGEEMAAKGTAQAYRHLQFRGRWARTEAELKALPEAQRRWFSEVPVPDAFQWSHLRGMYVPKWLAAHLGLEMPGSGWENMVARLISWGLRAQPGEATNMYTRGIIAPWKIMHTGLNLPTESRNIMTNGALTYLAAKIPAATILPYMTKGLGSVLRRDDAFRLASKLEPGISASFTAEELNFGRRALVSAKKGDELASVARVLAHSGDSIRKVANLYQTAELSAKMGVYLYYVEHGASASAAARIAVQTIFDYSDVSRALNWARRYGIFPFATYPVKMTKALAGAMIESPERFGRMARTLQAPGASLPPAERAQIEASMEERQAGGLIPLPFKNKQGERLVLDVAYIVPWQPWSDSGNLGVLDMNPVPRVLDDIARNRSSFTEREIYNTAMPRIVQLLAQADYFAKSMGPGWIVRGIPRIIGTRLPKARWMAPPEQPSAGRTGREIAGQILGVRTKPYRPTQEFASRVADSAAKDRQLTGELSKAARKYAAGEMSKEEFQATLDIVLSQVRQNKQELSERTRRFKGG